MIFLISESTDCYFNLALEEILLREYDEEVFMLWQNDNTIVVGKNQNTLAEINAEYVKEKGIRVVRRITGGGAVYHDMGNINYTYISKHSGEWESDFSRFATPVIRALSKLGVSAEVSGRNDIVVNGRKISGNAQTVIDGRLLHHGTLLLNTDVLILSKALSPDPEKIQSKGVKSVSSRVANICDLTDKKVKTSEITELIRCEVDKLYSAKAYKLSETEVLRVKKLADEKYRTWEWNFGYSPRYTFSKKMRFDGGVISAFLSIEEGIITTAKLYGDFFGISDVSTIENALCGVSHREDSILNILKDFKLNEFFGKISAEELLKVLI